MHEQLRHDRRDAAEVPGPSRLPLEALGDPEYLDCRREAVGVDLLDPGREQHVGARLRSELGVALLIPRIAVEVAALVELRGVDEQRDDDHGAVLAGLLDQRQVTLVQRAHRRHEPDPRLFAAGRREGFAQLGDCAHQPHRRAGVVCCELILGPAPLGVRREMKNGVPLRSIPGIAGDGLLPMIQAGLRDASA